MQKTARFVGLDLLALRPYLKNLLIPIVIVVVAAVLPTGSPYAIIPAAAVFGVIICPQYLFGNDERGHLDTLYTALGISRPSVVRGRYTSVLLIVGLLSVAGLIATPLFAVFLHTELDWAIAAAVAGGSAALIALLLLLQMPIYFAVGATRARTVGIAVPGALILLAVVIGRLLPNVGSELLSWSQTLSPAWTTLGVLATLLAVGFASAVVSTRLYSRRNL